MDGRSKVYTLAPVKQEEGGSGAAQQLDMDMEGLTDIQTVMGMGPSALQIKEEAPREPSLELEVKGDVLNKIIDKLGAKKLSKKKSYKVLIFPEKK